MSIGPFELVYIVWIVMLLAGAWKLCGKLGWSRWLTLLVFIPVLALVLAVVLAWEALPRAGHSRALVLLAAVPVVSGLILAWLAFRRWPEVQGLRPESV